MAISARMYRDASDLAAMQALLGRSWLAERPVVNCTAGDLEWWLVNDPDIDRSAAIRLWWEDGGELIGWALFEAPASLDWHVRLDQRGGAVSEAMLDWLEARAADGHADRGATAPVPPTAWAMDADEPTRGVLARRGYRPTDVTLAHWVRRLPPGGGPDLPDPSADLPSGYRLRSTLWPDDLERRVAVQRAAFAPSRMTLAKYRRLADATHYAPDRDWVVEAPDGSFAAFANAWWDPVGRIGELEPVGTHPDHRRLGLGRAVCLAAIARLADLGAPEVLVFSETSNPASQALYASLGATSVTVARRWTRPIDATGS